MTITYEPTARAQIITRRTYNRPLNDEGSLFETWEQTVDRGIVHQQWLWERQLGDTLIPRQKEELQELRSLMLQRKALVAGRALWMGGTDTIKRREASMFNCAFSETQSVHDIVDQFWLLLQGCGVGFKMMNGTLSGFSQKMEVEVVRSQKKVGDPRGREQNIESFVDGIWSIDVGDSAEAWAKAAGKLVVGRHRARKLRISLGEIRAAGQRLKGYGWLCTGDGPLSQAFVAIAQIRNNRAGRLLTKIDLMDIMNHLGTVLSTRRSAECALMDYGDPEWEAFAVAKPPGFFANGLSHRTQSNNGLCFWEKPSLREIDTLITLMADYGGSEPSFNNCAAAKKRAPWFRGFNPCYEILLTNRGFCNLIELFLHRFRHDFSGLLRAAYLISRANYRQTLVNLDDGILQRAWHENNQVLRLCGAGLTGVTISDPYLFKVLKNQMIYGAYSMADECGTERPNNVTTMKPSGTLSKVGDAPTEGINRALGRYIFNNVAFDKHDPILPLLQESGYYTFPHPTDPAQPVLVRLPFHNDADYFSNTNGMEINVESAVDQLDRYKLMNQTYTEQNTSCTISWEPREGKAMAKWFDRNWDDFIGCAFVFRNDPTKTAKDLGYAYLPQEVVTKKVYDDYVSRLKPFDIGQIGNVNAFDMPLELGTKGPVSDCGVGSCPIK
jgi:adenosylcobalamin-dependent ribonucleoside-triphosphate reductase